MHPCEYYNQPFPKGKPFHAGGFFAMVGTEGSIFNHGWTPMNTDGEMRGWMIEG